MREYNFSRSQSGILFARETSGAHQGGVWGEPRFDTQSSINFTNISYGGEVELLRGSAFEESIERDDIMDEHPSAAH